MKRAMVIVLDSVGCGDAPDAAAYGDAGADTLGHLFERIPGFDLPHLASLGLYQLLGLDKPSPSAWNRRFTISLMTSRGVKCSPAVSFEISANFRISSSKTTPIWALLTVSGWRSIPANFSVTR